MNEQKLGPVMKCSACKLVVHNNCVSKIAERNQFCKPSFEIADGKEYQEDHVSTTNHHWINHQNGMGTCKDCKEVSILPVHDRLLSYFLFF